MALIPRDCLLSSCRCRHPIVPLDKNRVTVIRTQVVDAPAVICENAHMYTDQQSIQKTIAQPESGYPNIHRTYTGLSNIGGMREMVKQVITRFLQMSSQGTNGLIANLRVLVHSDFRHIAVLLVDTQELMRFCLR